MTEQENDSLLDLVKKTLEFDETASDPVEKEGQELTFERDEKGVLWSVDAKTGKKVGRIYEHGDTGEIDEIEEV